MTEYPVRHHSGRDLHTHQGFIEELLERAHAVPVPTLAEYSAMTAEEQDDCDEDRRRIITQGIRVKNDSFSAVQRVLIHVMREHQYRSGGGYGVMISADSYLGKTTVLKMLLLDILVQRLREDPFCLDRGEVPVVYVSLPSTGTPLGLYRMLAEYLGIPIGRRETEATLEGMIQHTINAARTVLVVIDEVHNLKYGGVYSKKVSAALRRLGDDINAPIILSGIGLEHSNLLHGPEGAQILERYRTASISSYSGSIGSPKQKDMRLRWILLARSLIEAMPILGDNTHGLTRLALELHPLVKGRIGDLNATLSRAALDLIDAHDPENEVITKGLAEASALELAKEKGFKTAIAEEPEVPDGIGYAQDD